MTLHPAHRSLPLLASLFCAACLPMASCDRTPAEEPGKYNAREPDSPRNSEPPEATLEMLLRAVDQRDYPTIKVYADALFKDRKDILVRPEIEGLRDPVLRAAAQGDVRLVEALASARPAFGGMDERGRRAIHLAAINNQPDMIRWLCEHVDANPNDPVRVVHDTPLHLAAAENAGDAISKLLTLGANLNARSARGGTALHNAVSSTSTNATQILLQHSIGKPKSVGSLIEVRDEMGETALHAA